MKITLGTLLGKCKEANRHRVGEDAEDPNDYVGELINRQESKKRKKKKISSVRKLFWKYRRLYKLMFV